MTKFVIQRLALIPVVLVLVNCFGYTYAHYARPLRAARTPFTRAESTAPLFPAYLDYINSLVNLDFSEEVDLPGTSRSTQPISLGETLGAATLASLGLILISLMLSVPLGLLLAFMATQNDPPRTSRWLTVGSTVGLAMPSFYIGSLFIIALVSYVIWRGPGTNMPLPLDGFGWDEHLILPILALMARPAVQVAQMTAGVLTGELGKQYIIAARSFGNTWRAIRFRHALKNVLTPVILTIAGMQRFMIGELILVEWLFRWPGLGRLLAWTLVPAQLNSSRGSPLFLNPDVMADVLTIIAGLFLLIDFTAAISVRLLDPRLRDQEEQIAHKLWS